MLDTNYSVVGLIVLLLDLWAIISVVTSGASVARKVLWTVLILILPVLGFIAWFLVGPRASKEI